jgi:O-antigen ligase
VAQSRKRPKGSTNKPAATAAKKPAKSTKAAAPPITWGSTSERVAYYLLHALVFLVPVAISNFVWTGIATLPFSFDQFDLAKVMVQRVVTIAALAAWAWSFLTHGGKLRKSSFYWLIGAFLGWALLSSVFSIHVPTALFGKYRRLEGFFSFVNYAAVFFLVLQLIDKPAKMRSLIRTLFFSNIIVCGYALMQWQGLDPIQWGQLPFEARRAFSTYGNPDLLGGFLMFTLPTSLALALSEDDLIWRIVYWVGFLATAVVTMISFVRGAWVGAAVSMPILIFAVVWLRDRLKATDWAFAGVAAASVVGLATYSSVKGQGVMNFWERVSSITAFGEGSARSRFEIWEAAVSAIKARPLFGFGPDTFRLVFPLYKPAAYTRDAGYLSVADNVHNYPLQLTAGVGIPGTLMLYGLIGWELVATARHAFDRDAGYKRLLYAGIWAAVCGYVMLLMTGLSVTGSTLFLWIFLGLLAVPLARSVDVPAPAWGQMAAVGAVVLAIFAGGYWMWWGSADWYYLLGRIGPISNDQKVIALQTAVARNPFNDMYRAELPLRYQDAFISLAQQGSQEQRQGQNAQQTLAAARLQFDMAEQGLLDVIAFVPYEYDNYVFLANLYNQAGTFFNDPAYFTKALGIANQGIAVEPFGPAIKVQAAIAYASLNQYAKALEQLDAAVKLDPAFKDPKVLRAEILSRSGQLQKGLAAYRELVKTYPDDQQLQAQMKGVEAKVGSATPAPKK